MEPEKELYKQMPVRVALAVLLGIIISFIVPAPQQSVTHGADIAAALVFAVILMIIARRVTARRQELRSAVYLELNKLRRIYHISKNLTAGSSRFRPWFMEIHGNLHMYLAAFEGSHLRDYRQNNPGFRRLSYHIYTAPELETDKERQLYADLLKTTGRVAETRQKIKELVKGRLEHPEWSWLMVAAFTCILAVLSSADAAGGSRLAVGMLIGVVLASLDYIWRIDKLDREMLDWTGRYVRNISKLEYRRHD
jgi:hypothetical protein